MSEPDVYVRILRMVQIAGSRILLTGASSGIGAALAPELAARGAVLALVARRGERLAEVVDRCNAHTPGSRGWVLDLGDVDAAEALALEVWDELGPLDVLVNNAAMPKRRHVTVITPDEVVETMRVNFESPVRMALALLPRMLTREHGMIVNVASFGGRVGILDETAYCASKFALCGWTEAMAMDLWHHPVDVRLILPGAIDTEIWERSGSDPAVYDGPLEPPETVADAIIAAIEGDRFEHYVPDLSSIAEFKTADIEGFMEGAVAFADERGRTGGR